MTDTERIAQLEAENTALHDALLEASEVIRRRDQVALEEHPAVLDLLARADAALAAAERL